MEVKMKIQKIKIKNGQQMQTQKKKKGGVSKQRGNTGRRTGRIAQGGGDIKEGKINKIK